MFELIGFEQVILSTPLKLLVLPSAVKAISRLSGFLRLVSYAEETVEINLVN